VNGSGGLNPPVFKVDNPSCTRNFWPLRGIGVTPLLPCVRLLTLIMWQNKLPADLKIQESRSADPTGELTVLPRTRPPLSALLASSLSLWASGGKIPLTPLLFSQNLHTVGGGPWLRVRGGDIPPAMSTEPLPSTYLTPPPQPSLLHPPDFQSELCH